MLVLVTGGAGFVGSALTARLLERGDTVRVFSRGDYPALRALGVETLRGDLQDAEAVGAAAEHVELVFHVAAKTGYFGDPAEYDAINIRGTQNVVSACRGQGVGRLVFTSSPSVIASGGALEGVDESHPYPTRFVADYARTKAAAEIAVLAADGEEGLRTVAIRPRGVWGPGDTQLFPRLVQWTKEGRLKKIGSKDPLQDFAFISNVVDAHLLAADKLGTDPDTVGGKAYFISDGAPVGCWTMVSKCLATAGLSLPPRAVPLWLARCLGVTIETIWKLFRLKSEPRLNRYKVATLTQPCHFDISAARRDLGYEPTVALNEGMRELRAWVETGGLDAVLAAGV
jgi:nucleoside-diphosphate-sugar epimerase